MPLTLRPVTIWRLPFHGLRKENSFCAAIAAKGRACAACLQLQEKLTQDARNQPATRACVYGLCETAVPVKLGDQTIGFLQTGQVLRQRPTEASFQVAVAQAVRRGVTIDDESTRRAYFATPVLTPKRLHAATSLLTLFADHLAMKGNQLAVQSAHVESPIIAQARQYIAAHYAENLSLGRVSQHVNTSRFYFCKLFCQATGLSFTEFVSRIRVEKARRLLLNRHLRVSEIAFTAGFKSLGHFARMFRKIVGQSPSDYRGALPGAVPRRAGRA